MCRLCCPLRILPHGLFRSGNVKSARLHAGTENSKTFRNLSKVAFVIFFMQRDWPNSLELSATPDVALISRSHKIQLR